MEQVPAWGNAEQCCPLATLLFIHISAKGEQLLKESVKQAPPVQGPGACAQRHPKGRTWREREVVLGLMLHRKWIVWFLNFLIHGIYAFQNKTHTASWQRSPCRLLADRSLESTFHWGIPPIAHIYHGTSHTAQRKGRRGTDCRTEMFTAQAIQRILVICEEKWWKELPEEGFCLLVK